MDVFLVPIGDARYELYCEAGDRRDDEEEGADETVRAGWLARLSRSFHGMVAAADRPHEVRGSGWADRLRRRLLAWVAERVAEQRLLWQLRRRRSAVLVHPADLSNDAALEIARASLRRDADRHRRWLWLSGVGFVLSGALAIFPGPNLVAYYFAFLVVGHYLSSRGARHGLERVTWTARGSAELEALRGAEALGSPLREQKVRDVAERLQLPHLARFFERMALRSA